MQFIEVNRGGTPVHISLTLEQEGGTFSGSFVGDGSGLSILPTQSIYTLTSSFNAFTASYYNDSASIYTRIENVYNSESRFVLTSSYIADSSSFDLRINNSFLSESRYLLTSSYTTDSASFNLRINNVFVSESNYVLTSSYTTDSSSFDLRINNTFLSESNYVLTSSYTTDSASFNSQISTNTSGLANIISRTASFATTGSNTFWGNQTITGSVNVTGSITTYGIIGTGSTPSVSAGAGAGTSSLFSITGSDVSGEIWFTVGTTPSLNADIFTVTFASPLGKAPQVFLFASNDNAAQASRLIYARTRTTTSFVMTNTTNTLNNGNIFKFQYLVIQ